MTALNKFLHKIKRKDSPNCSFCNTEPQTFIHFFIDCNIVKSIWDQTLNSINKKSNKIINASKFDKMFGYLEDKFVTYIFIILKYYIY